MHAVQWREDGISAEPDGGADANSEGASPADASDAADALSDFDAMPGDVHLMRSGACDGRTYCADFDTSATAEWDMTSTKAGGQLTSGVVVGNDSVALRATVPAVSSGVEGTAYVASKFAGARRVRAELDVFVDNVALSAGATFTVVQISGTAALKEAGLTVLLQNGSPNLGFYVDHGDMTNNLLTGKGVALPIAQWVHVVIDVRFGPNGRALVEVGSSTALDTPLATVNPPEPALRVGIGRYLAATPSLVVYYDTVRADAWSGLP